MSIREKSLIAVILIVAAILQVCAASQKSFWEDEAETVNIAQSGLKNISHSVSVLHPPLYFYSATLWGRLFGYTELPLRSLSIIFGLATIVLASIFAYQVFNPRTAILTAALLSLSPLFLTYAHNARYYSMSAALSLGTALAILNYFLSFHSTRYFWLAVYTLCSIAMLYTSYTTFAVILACGIWWLVNWLHADRDKKELGIFILANLVVALAFLPIFPKWLATTKGLIPDASSYAWVSGIFNSAAYLGFVFSVGETTSPLNPAAWLALATVTILAVYLITRLKRLPHSWIPLMFVVVIEVFVILINGILKIPRFQALPHWTLYALPFFLIWLASGLTSLKVKPILVFCSFLAVAYLVGDINYYSGQQFLTPQLTVPWREIMADLRAKAPDGTVVICNKADTTCAYYGKRYQLALYKPQDWSGLIKKNPKEVWWFQSNLSTYYYNNSNEQAILKAVDQHFDNKVVKHYGLNDQGIRWIKTEVLKQNDYAYRLDVYRFTGFVSN
jgi:uncharacterized membrane protein